MDEIDDLSSRVSSQCANARLRSTISCAARWIGEVVTKRPYSRYSENGRLRHSASCQLLPVADRMASVMAWTVALSQTSTLPTKSSAGNDVPVRPSRASQLRSQIE